MIKPISKKKALLAFGDIVLLLTGYMISPYLRYGFSLPEYTTPSIPGAFLFCGVYVFCFYLMDLYDFKNPFSSVRYLFRFAFGFLIAMVFVALGSYFIPAFKIGRVVFFISILFTFFSAYLWRIFLEWAFKSFFEKPRKVLIVGSGNKGMDTFKLIKNNRDFEVVGFIDSKKEKGNTGGLNILGGFNLLDEMVIHHEVDAIIITIEHPDDPSLLKCILDSKMSGVQIYDVPGFFEETTGKVPVEHLSDLWFINTPILGVKRSFYNNRVKRVFDIICALLCLLVSIPAIIVTVIMIKSESKGPVLYRQTRTGLYGEPFDVVKFRSMRNDAEKDGAVWAAKNDSRVTRYGAIIRKLRIDELPQVWNVLKGEMSFVGPRPERPEFVKTLREKIPYYALRDSVKPGLTGWAQINYPYGSTEEDALKKLQYDLFYIKNLSPILDSLIILRTFKVLIYRKGSR